MSLRNLFSALIILALAMSVHAQELVQEDDKEGGIIGTGIVGTVTQLGSIYVNGHHILFDDTLLVAGGVTPMTASDLRPGHVVAVTVLHNGKVWRAKSVRQIFPLVGPVEAVSGARITVLGTQVDIDTSYEHPTVGDWVAISGLWQGRGVQASRLDPVPHAKRQARISGSYLGSVSDGHDMIGGTKIIGIETQHLELGDVVRVIGPPGKGGIEATQLERHLFDEAVNLVQVEGYFSRPLSSGLYTVLGSGLTAYTDRPEMIEQRNKVLLCGEDGGFGVQTSNSENSEELQQRIEHLNCKP